MAVLLFFACLAIVLGVVGWLTSKEPPHDDMTCPWCAEDPIPWDITQWSQDAIRWLHRCSTVADRYEAPVFKLCMALAGLLVGIALFQLAV